MSKCDYESAYKHIAVRVYGVLITHKAINNVNCRFVWRIGLSSVSTGGAGILGR